MVQQASEEEIIRYCIDRGIDVRTFYCIECGAFLKYKGADIHFQVRDGLKGIRGDMIFEGVTFMSSREYCGQRYMLCRCKECVGKKFPEIFKHNGTYTMQASRPTQYAFGVPDELFEKYCKERQSITLEKFIKVHGDEEGHKRFDEYCRKQAESNSFEYKRKKHGFDMKQYQDYNKSRAVTIENLVKKYGDVEGQRRFDEYCERQRYTISKDYFIKTYGEKAGLEKYQDFDRRRLAYRGYSQVANDCFREIVKCLDLSQHELYYAALNHEYDVLGYRLDFYDLTANVAIEFYGDFWHCNPPNYKAGDVWKSPFDGRTISVEEIWRHDRNREELITNELSCKFFCIRENEWRRDKAGVIERIRKIYL